MRKRLSWVAILSLFLPVAPAAGIDLNLTKGSPYPAGSMQERLRDMSREAALFLDGSAESELLWLHGVDLEQRYRDWQVQIRQHPLGSESVDLSDIGPRTESPR